MKQRSLITKEDLVKASNDLLNLEANLPLVITVTEGKKIRTNAQNARYWSEIKYFMDEINAAIDRSAEESGYSNIEVRRLLADHLQIEQAIILYARKSEVVHSILKDICGIATSTKLGTKAFSKFDERLSQTMTEILGDINSFLRR